MNTNNRYIKTTVFADRVRLAYIVYIGEIPGQAARGRLDKDRDGVLSDAEVAVFRDQWSARVKDALVVEAPGVELPVVWSSATVGLGDPRTSSGAFSLDLIAWLCPPGDARRLRIVDTLVIPDPGESEVLAEESPGVEITTAALGERAGTRHTWTGGDHLIKTGFDLAWRAGTDAPPAPGTCPAPPGRSALSSLWLYAAAAIAFAIIAAAFVMRRRAKKPPVDGSTGG